MSLRDLVDQMYLPQTRVADGAWAKARHRRRARTATAVAAGAAAVAAVVGVALGQGRPEAVPPPATTPGGELVVTLGDGSSWRVTADDFRVDCATPETGDSASWAIATAPHPDGPALGRIEISTPDDVAVDVSLPAGQDELQIFVHDQETGSEASSVGEESSGAFTARVRCAGGERDFAFTFGDVVLDSEAFDGRPVRIDGSVSFGS